MLRQARRRCVATAQALPALIAARRWESNIGAYTGHDKHNPLVPAVAARQWADMQADEEEGVVKRFAKELQPQRLVTAPPKRYRPLSLKAREEIKSRAADQYEHVPVSDEAFGQRVDEFVMSKYPHLEYGQMKRLVEQGEIYRYRMNGKRRYTKVTDRLELGEMVVLPPSVRRDADALNANVSASPDGVVEPQIISEEASQVDRDGRVRRRVPLSAKVREEAYKWMLFKNKHVIVINKPSGVPMNGGPGVGLNVSDMLPAWQFTAPTAPLLVHRLDQDTSGIVVLARSPEAQKQLGRMFTRRSTPNSVYWGMLVGKPESRSARIRMHLEIMKEKGGTRIVARTSPTPGSRTVLSEYTVNANASRYMSFVSFYPLTSQTSQLRIMAAHALGCPILGDAKFGGEEAFPRTLGSIWDPDDKGLPLHLHHRKIQLPYKNNRGEFECVTAPLPPHVEKTFKKLGWPTNLDDPLIVG